MSEPTARHEKSPNATVYLCGIKPSMRDWIAENVPDVTLSRERTPETKVVCYGEDFLQRLETEFDDNSRRKLRTVLCLEDPFPGSYLHALQLHVRHIIYPGSPFDTNAIRLALNPPLPFIPGKDTPFFTSPLDDLRSVAVHDLKSATDLDIASSDAEMLCRELGCTDGQAENASLVIKEAVTNALYHGFRQTASHERKYDPSAFTALEDGDQVQAAVAAGPGWVLARVTDNSGALGPLRLGNSLDRQRSEQGLFDSRGRGFYLMRHLSNRMVVSIKRGEATSLEFYFLHTPPSKEQKAKKHFELIEF